jgi:hypothetical protein
LWASAATADTRPAARPASAREHLFISVP